MAENVVGRRLGPRRRRRQSTPPPDLSGRVDELTDHVVRDIFTQLESFAEAGDEYRGIVEIVVRRIVTVIVDTSRDGRLATRAELRELVDMTVPGAELGITLEDMLEVFHIALDVLWWEMHRLVDAEELKDPRAALDLSHLGVQLITELSRGVTKAYLEGDRIWVHREDAEQVLIEGVLSDPPRIEPALRAARALDLPIFENWRCATYLPLEGGPDVHQLRAAVSTRRRHDRLRGAVGIVSGAVVLVVAGNGDAPAAPEGACVGVGRIRQGTVGIRRGHDESREAADAARRRGLVRLEADDAMLDRVFTGSLSTAELADAVLAPLLELSDEKCGPLLETLEALLDANGSPTAAARTLNLHPQSLRYRIRILRSHLGDEALDDPEARLRLHLAVKSRRLG